MAWDDALDDIVARHGDLSALLASGDMPSEDYATVSKEYSDLDSVVGVIKDYQSAISERDGAKELLTDEETSAEMRELAEMEIEELEAKLPELEHAIKLALIPKDEADEKNAILEVRAGTGGDEAALFAQDLLQMYAGYAKLQGWKFEIMELSETDIGGISKASANVSGKGVFARLKFESGVHRVQRVPKTESQGRIHTSAATVAVLPEAEEVDVQIEDKDLRIDFFRASGPGGQSVNTTDSAVRITHIPTGIVVSQQDEKSQHKNKAKGMKVLRSRVYEAERQAKMAERAAARKSQVGSGDRSERIRTYNFPQGRVSDHRINLTLYKLDAILMGEGLDEIINGLTADDQAQQLAGLGDL